MSRFYLNDAWRTGKWYDVLGEAYVDDAFIYARAADPSAKLYLNDFNIEYPGVKLDAMYALVAGFDRPRDAD